MKKILIIGCGSIGSRHAKNAKKIGIENIVLCDADAERSARLCVELNANKAYQDYKKAVDENQNILAAIIATPTSLHIEPAIYCAENKINLFIEKPLSHNLEDVDKLIETIEKNKLVAMMGQSFRFHEGYNIVKRMLEEKTIGKIYHANYTGGQYLPHWHPYADYRKEYSAQKKMGGGVLLTSMSHAFDIVEWLFGNIDFLQGWKEKLSNLEIDVEDSVFCLAKTSESAVVYCQFDFLQKEYRNNIRIAGENGHINADFMKHEIEIYDGRSYNNIKYAFDQNKRYVDELVHFTKLVEENKTNHELTISRGKRILELINSPNIIKPQSTKIKK